MFEQKNRIAFQINSIQCTNAKIAPRPKKKTLIFFLKKKLGMHCSQHMHYTHFRCKAIRNILSIRLKVSPCIQIITPPPLPMTLFSRIFVFVPSFCPHKHIITTFYPITKMCRIPISLPRKGRIYTDANFQIHKKKKPAIINSIIYIFCLKTYFSDILFFR